MKKYPYSVGTAVIYSFALLATLWWLPVLGPIIIGYITGRKAGGPVKGLVAMAIPIILYFVVAQAINRGVINVPPVIKTYIEGTILTSTGALQLIEYFEKSTNIAMQVATNITHYLYYAPPSFFIMLSFAFIGGAVSRQVILERGIYREKKRTTKPFKLKEEKNEENFDRSDSRRAPIKYNSEPQPVTQQVTYAPHGRSPPIPTYDYTPQNSPQYAPNYAPQPTPQLYPQYEYPRYPLQEEEHSKGLIHKYRNKMQKQTIQKPRKRKKQIKPFQTGENSKFVVHPMEQPKSVLIKKKRVNRNSSIAFL